MNSGKTLFVLSPFYLSSTHFIEIEFKPSHFDILVQINKSSIELKLASLIVVYFTENSLKKFFVSKKKV